MAVCLDLQPADSHLFDSSTPNISRNSSLLGAKRSRCSEEAQLAGGLTQKPCVWSAPPCYLALEREAHSQGGLQSSLPHNQIASRSSAFLEPMSGRLASSAGAERSLSPGGAEVVSLRAAATAAVAECTGGLGIVGATSRPPADDPQAPASGQSADSLQDSQSLGTVTHNTQNLSIQAGTAAEAGPEAHQQGHQPEHPADAFQACPPHGAKAICGRRPKMEDAYTAIPFLLEVPIPAGQLGVNELIPPRIATHVRTASSAPSDQGNQETHSSAGQSSAEGVASTPHLPQGAYSPFMETLHFFGVFDGHGGAEAALHCAQTLHQRIAEALSAVSSPAAADKIKQSFAASQAETAAALGNVASNQPSCKCPPGQPCTCGKRQTQSHLKGSFSDAKLQALAEPKPIQEGDRKASDSDDSETNDAVTEAILEHRRESRQIEGSQPTAKVQSSQSADAQPADAQQLQQQQSSESVEAQAEGTSVDSDGSTTTTKIESALTNAFTRADEEFGKADNAALVGTTAVVALVGSRQLYVANCGDSRAVLSRGDVAIPLTDDHKAAREDETARVEAAGGQILFWNGVRVMGVLAVSRAIGDHCLRPFVIAQPEITILARKPDDELLLLASDGLWDVLTNQEACSLAKRCLRRARQRGATRQSAARIAATVLTRAAVDRGSRDNVTVVVVDLMSGPESEELSRQPSSMVDGFENFNSDDVSEPGYPGKSPRLSETSEVSQ